ncbi:major latex protein 15-like [Cucumis melo var. makuwa]|uniref:Major latex protein 15-like n=1 Tax=Cucumis melo var. makuwa TaxID=1194695 RepID=A0A5A7ULW6_CUCMM|nr:major latex protein 15-like [Cucumis melo var. makuwa]TYK01530.1 major latex protein 15-like [Cucumis melo var. makuwa]
MAQICSISEEVKLKACGQKFYHFFLTKMDVLNQMFPQNINSTYEFVEGNSFTHGTVIHWKYDFGGGLEESKVRLGVDEPNKSITMECLEGDVLKEFETFKVKVQVKDSDVVGVNSVVWCVEFVKANEDVAPPHNHLKCGIKVCKDLDAYLCNN